MSAALFEDLQQMEVDAPIELWQVDNTANGGITYYFHSANTNGVTSDLDHDSITYSATALTVTGLGMTSQSKQKPKMAIGTAVAVVLNLLVDTDLLLGAKVTRIKTLAKYLDAGATPDATAIEPTVIFYVEQLESADESVVTYRLADPSDLPQVMLPRQIVTANLCTTCYRGETCQYAGDPVTDEDNSSFGVGPFTDRGTWNAATADYVADDYVSINSPDGNPVVFVVPSAFVGSVTAGLRPLSTGSDLAWQMDVCHKKTDDCELRFNAQTVGLPFDAFPGVARLPG